MQRQLENEPMEQSLVPPKKSRSVWELGVSCLLIVVGAVTAVICGLVYLGEMQRGYTKLLEVILYAFWMLQSILGMLGGFFSLIRSRILVRWLLSLAALSSLGTTIVLVVMVAPMIMRRELYSGAVFKILLIFMGLFSLAGLLFFLSRWLGREDDRE